MTRAMPREKSGEKLRAHTGRRAWGWIRVLHVSLLAYGIVLGLSAGCSRGQAGRSSASSAGSSDSTATSPTLAHAESTHTSADSASARAADTARAAGGRAGTSATHGARAGAGVTQLELGATLFQKHCARCHGPDGRGDGPGVYTLDVKPQNFHDAEHMATRTDEDLLISIRHGRDMAAMPRWDSILSEEEIHAVLRYVRTFATRP